MDYAQARLQAQFGERPDESVWQKLEAAPEPSVALEIARSSGLRRWVAGITPHADSHAIEIALRAGWRECVSEIATWMPGRWQPALLWTRGLVDLPALWHLGRGGAPLPWVLRDPVLQVYARADPKTLEVMLREACGASLGSAREDAGGTVLPDSACPSHILQAWLDEWRRRWPRRSDTASLEDLARLFDAAMKQPAAMGRNDLARKLRSLFRRSVLHPVAAFIYIAFVTLDIERLRAGLLKHRLARDGVIAS
ncbi:MAG: hypothetical protein HY661_10700 [Betaproteobacteria bacterium]|nr:hypothetical protein [Betaproteobacteria bacterium]